MNIENQELQHVEKPSRIISVLTGMIVGGLVGAGTMLLFAPQPGEKTRANIKEGVSELRNRTTETVNGTLTQVKTRANQVTADVKVKVHDLQHQGQDLVARQLDRISHVAENGKKALQVSQN